MTNENYTPEELVPEIDETAETVEEPAVEPENTTEASLKEKPNELEALTKKYNDLNDRYLRIVAEYDNFRKRSQKERDEIYPNATAAAVGKFLPVLDNFERAAAFPHGDDEFGKGFDMIYQSFKEILAAVGAEEIGEAGEAFDPEKHHAVMHIEDENLGENVVSAVLQKGYRLGGKVIRYAMVQTAN